MHTAEFICPYVEITDMILTKFGTAVPHHLKFIKLQHLENWVTFLSSDENWEVGS